MCEGDTKFRSRLSVRSHTAGVYQSRYVGWVGLVFEKLRKLSLSRCLLHFDLIWLGDQTSILPSSCGKEQDPTRKQIARQCPFFLRGELSTLVQTFEVEQCLSARHFFLLHWYVTFILRILSDLSRQNKRWFLIHANGVTLQDSARKKVDKVEQMDKTSV